MGGRALRSCDPSSRGGGTPMGAARMCRDGRSAVATAATGPMATARWAASASVGAGGVMGGDVVRNNNSNTDRREQRQRQQRWHHARAMPRRRGASLPLPARPSARLIAITVSIVDGVPVIAPAPRRPVVAAARISASHARTHTVAHRRHGAFHTRTHTHARTRKRARRRRHRRPADGCLRFARERGGASAPTPTA